MGTNGGYNGLNPKLTKDDIDKLIHRYRIGVPVAQLATEFDITTSAIYYHTRVRQVPRQPRQPRNARPDQLYTCQGCGQTKQFKPGRDGAKPTHCRYCKRVDLGPRQTHAGVPQLLAAEGTCAQIGDTDLFYPDKGGSNKKAKAVCRACPVAAECLDYALANNERFGIWGGLSERERRKLTKTTAA
jgi:WhiB family redox-sensing transcriptional regulator